jgi:ribosomal protein S18 acetylase RimI-like enzyme
MGYLIEEMFLSHFEQTMQLWKASDGVHLKSVDSRETIGRFLERNSGLSYVAMENDKVIGAVLCSHDGRIGFLTHLAVDPDYRRQGIGRSLVGRCLYALMGIGISQCGLMLFEEDQNAINFFKTVALSGRVEMLMMKKLQ